MGEVRAICGWRKDEVDVPVSVSFLALVVLGRVL